MKKKIIVTGGLGFIGLKVVLQLLKRGIPTIVTDLDIDKNKNRLKKNLKKHNVSEDLINYQKLDITNINKPVSLIWGAEDKVTPPHVAEEFHKLLPDSELNWIPLCGHAAMWEHPKRFSELVLEFLKKRYSKTTDDFIKDTYPKKDQANMRV